MPGFGTYGLIAICPYVGSGGGGWECKGKGLAPRLRLRLPAFSPSAPALSVVNLAAVTDQQHKHGHFSVIDTVDDPVSVDRSSDLSTLRSGYPRHGLDSGRLFQPTFDNPEAADRLPKTR